MNFGIWKIYKAYIKKLDRQYILNKSKYCGPLEAKILFLSIADSCTYQRTVNNEKYFSHRIFNVYVRECKIVKNKLRITATYYNFGNKQLFLYMVDNNNKIYLPIVSTETNSRYDLTYGNFHMDETHIRKFEIPLSGWKNINFILYDDKQKQYYAPKKIVLNQRTNFELKNGKIWIRYKQYGISFNGRRFRIRKYKEKQIVHLFRTIKIIKADYGYFAWERLFSRRKKKYILINDRPEKAGDNGEAFFKYICDEKKEVSRDTFFVVSRNSNDYRRLKKYGKVVPYGSIKHKILFLNAKYIYSSHNLPLFFYAFEEKKVKFYADLFNYKFVFLQHGISLNDISYGLNKYKTMAEAVVVTTPYEYKEYLTSKCLYNNEVILTGLPRYDLLVNNPSNFIIVMPTWRRWLTGRALSDGTHETKNSFNETEYFKNYAQLLCNNKLLNKLQENNLIIKFVIHPGMARYSYAFDQFANDNVQILKFDAVNYNELITKGRLLITDYSSVFTDFGYLKKPEIYFQFDELAFFEGQYKRGYFDYRTMGFGDVVDTPNKVVTKIIQYIENNFTMEEKYLERVDQMFYYRDQKNSERVFRETYK